MASHHIDQDADGPLVTCPEALAPQVRRALFEARLAFREEPAREGQVVFHLDESTQRSTIYRALESLS